MESTERLVRTWIASQHDQKIEQLVSEISARQTNLLNVVKALGEYLTSEDETLRSKGVELLSAVIGKSPVEIINQKTTHVLLAFYCSKLDDLETIIPALKGLVPLTKLPTLASEDVPTLIRALFAHVKMKTLVQSIRFLVFSIFDNLMASHRQGKQYFSRFYIIQLLLVLQTMDKEFLDGYISLADGEKDPRNLLIAFAIARVILIEFDVSDYVEPMFDITYCYFPITFRPPPNDPYGISTEDLRLALRSCLNATSLFGPPGIPLLIDKLVAGSPATKKDTLETMSDCFPVFGRAVLQSSARKLWNVLKLEIFQPSDRATEAAALQTLRVLVETIYPSGEETTATEGLLQNASEECLEILQEPEKSLARPAVKVLCAFMETSLSAADYTVAQTIPHLTKLYASKDDIATRPSILLLLSDLIAASRRSMSKSATDDSEARNPLTPFVDDLLSVVISGLQTTTTRQPSLACLLGLVSCIKLLSEEELGFIVQSANDILTADSEDSDDDASDAVVKLLTSISEISPRHLKEQTLPLLFTSLPEKAPSREAIAERARLWRTLSILKTLCHSAELFETLVIRLTTKLDLLCFQTVSDPDAEPTAAYGHAILLIISQTIAAKADNEHPDIPKYIETLVPRLFNLFIYGALAPNSLSMVINDTRLIQAAVQIVILIVQSVSPSRQEIFSKALFSTYLEGQLDTFVNGQHKIAQDAVFLPFDESGPSAHKALVPLFAAAIIAFRQEIPLPVSGPSSFLSSMLRWSQVQAENDLQKSSCWHIISSVVNKRVDDIMPFLETLSTSFWDEQVVNISTPLQLRKNALRAWTAVCKALLVRNHPLASELADRLFDIFSDDAIGWDAAKAIGEIVAADTVLTKRNHFIVKILCRQRFVMSALPRIVAASQDPNKEYEQSAYLVALASLIKSAPKATYTDSIPSLVPLLLRGLNLPDPDIRANVIETLLAAADGDSAGKNVVSEYASSLVSAMLKNSHVGEMPSVRVRTAATRYLGVLPSIVRYDVLHPYKSRVIRDLGIALDDPRRSVRKEAVEARTNWFKYNG